MTDRNKADTISPFGVAMTNLHLAAMVPPALSSLSRAVDLSKNYPWQFDVLDIERVEALWELLDGDATSHGFVLRMRDGSRCYLQYVMALGFADDENKSMGEAVVEDVEMLAMGGERYPDLQGGGVYWSDDVDELNRLLH